MGVMKFLKIAWLLPTLFVYLSKPNKGY